jgi:hypothetical protein
VVRSSENTIHESILRYHCALKGVFGSRLCAQKESLTMQLIRRLLVILSLTLLGSLVAGLYGICHDQITYSIAPEYFSKFKFRQFAFANMGLPARLFVSQVGFLATWWVGFLSGLILSTLACLLLPLQTAIQRAAIAFGIVLLGAVSGGLIGEVLGYIRRSDHNFQNWREYAIVLDIKDLPAFVNVGYIHNASYIGGVIGLAAGVLYLIGLRIDVQRGKVVRVSSEMG